MNKKRIIKKVHLVVNKGKDPTTKLLYMSTTYSEFEMLHLTLLKGISLLVDDLIVWDEDAIPSINTNYKKEKVVVYVY